MGLWDFKKNKKIPYFTIFKIKLIYNKIKKQHKKNMKLDKFAFKQGLLLQNLIKKEDKLLNVDDIFNDHLYYSRQYSIWNDNFLNGYLKNLKKKDILFFKTFYDNFFKEEYSISHIDISNINFIIKNKIKYEFDTKKENDFKDYFEYLFYKRTIFYKKTLYNLCYFFTKMNSFYNKKDLLSFLENINKISLTQKIFKNNNGSYTFQIPKNKGPFFSFWINNKMVNIDPFISYEINKKIEINSLVFSTLMNDENPKNIQNNIIKIHKEYPDIIDEKLKEIINNNDFQNYENYSYFSFVELNKQTGLMNHQDEVTLKKLSIESNFLHSFYINEKLYESFFLRTLNIRSNFNSKIESIEKRKFWINKFFISLFTKEDHKELINKLKILNKNIYNNIHLNTINKIKELNNLPDHRFLEACFYDFGFESSSDFNSFILKTKENYSNNKLTFSYLNNNDYEIALSNTLSRILNTN
jgi:hypothetical protein